MSDTTDLAALGMPKTVYVRPSLAGEHFKEEQLSTHNLAPDQTIFLVYKADGSPVWWAHVLDTAISTALNHDYELATVH